MKRCSIKSRTTSFQISPLVNLDVPNALAASGYLPDTQRTVETETRHSARIAWKPGDRLYIPHTRNWLALGASTVASTTLVPTAARFEKMKPHAR